MLSLSKGLFILLGLLCFESRAALPQINIATYTGQGQIDTIIYIGQDVPKPESTETAPAVYQKLFEDLRAFKKVIFTPAEILN